jgi:hypothetical protein
VTTRAQAIEDAARAMVDYEVEGGKAVSGLQCIWCDAEPHAPPEAHGGTCPFAGLIRSLALPPGDDEAAIRMGIEAAATWIDATVNVCAEAAEKLSGDHRLVADYGVTLMRRLAEEVRAISTAVCPECGGEGERGQWVMVNECADWATEMCRVCKGTGRALAAAPRKEEDHHG